MSILLEITEIEPINQKQTLFLMNNELKELKNKLNNDCKFNQIEYDKEWQIKLDEVRLKYPANPNDQGGEKDTQMRHSLMYEWKKKNNHKSNKYKISYIQKKYDKLQIKIDLLKIEIELKEKEEKRLKRETTEAKEKEEKRLIRETTEAKEAKKIYDSKRNYEPIECTCGRKVSKLNMKKHLTTNIHLNNTKPIESSI